MVQILLFLATVLSTYWVGSHNPEGYNGFVYAGPLMLILLCHEGAHYLMCRLYGVKATPPNFIPAPFTAFGTFGALIFMKENLPSRKAIFDIGAAGPLCGFIVTIPCIFIGLRYSRIVSVGEVKGLLSVGDPLMFKIATRLWFGSLPGKTIILHPMAFAGWIGLLVTALNLLPAGQLDGGHVAYAVLGRRSHLLFWPLIAGLLALIVALDSAAYVLFVFVLIVFGRKHPPPVDDTVPLDRRRKLLSLVLVAMFVLSFTPVPITLAQP